MQHRPHRKPDAPEQTPQPEPCPYRRPGCPGPGKPTLLSLAVICPLEINTPARQAQKYRQGTDVKAIAVDPANKNCRRRFARAWFCRGLSFMDRPRIRPASARPRPGAERTAVQMLILAR